MQPLKRDKWVLIVKKSCTLDWSENVTGNVAENKLNRKKIIILWLKG